jgi:hypothetical protein
MMMRCWRCGVDIVGTMKKMEDTDAGGDDDALLALWG